MAVRWLETTGDKKSSNASIRDFGWENPVTVQPPHFEIRETKIKRINV
jgi:hypothetical protein